MRKLDGPTLENPPLTDEVEVSVFGPGFGECIVVHLTEQSWLVVDSCIDARTKEPAALVYFEKIGVDAAKDVRFVISTHWHDDHIRGIGRVVGKCELAKFVCAHGLGSKEFKTLVSLYSNYFPSGGPGIEEMR
jgi:glyoxylase-like metal-dependent hydrolase (beta-lactamase superfamily II)